MNLRPSDTSFQTLLRKAVFQDALQWFGNWSRPLFRAELQPLLYESAVGFGGWRVVRDFHTPRNRGDFEPPSRHRQCHMLSRTTPTTQRNTTAKKLQRSLSLSTLRTQFNGHTASLDEMVGVGGFEPPPRGLQPLMLPLHQTPNTPTPHRPSGRKTLLVENTENVAGEWIPSLLRLKLEKKRSWTVSGWTVELGQTRFS